MHIKPDGIPISKFNSISNLFFYTLKSNLKEIPITSSRRGGGGEEGEGREGELEGVGASLSEYFEAARKQDVILLRLCLPKSELFIDVSHTLKAQG